jgi:hypothetical protein
MLELQLDGTGSIYSLVYVVIYAKRQRIFARPDPAGKSAPIVRKRQLSAF